MEYHGFQTMWNYPFAPIEDGCQRPPAMQQRVLSVLDFKILQYAALHHPTQLSKEDDLACNDSQLYVN